MTFVQAATKLIQERREAREEGELEDQASRRVAPEQRVGHERAGGCQYARLDEWIVRQIG